ncbi:MAG: ComF family protein [Lachnospiraceae bacterium]|nr:ComF family protein [Lachnospiraceae bacterium]
MRNQRWYIEKIVQLFYPRRCPVCDDAVPMKEGLACEACRKKIRYIREPKCRKCGKELRQEEKILCADCTNRRHEFDYGIALYDYQSMKESIYRFKYQKRCEYAKFYAQEIWNKYEDEIKRMEADVLIPVPLHKSKLKLRGYNQAELIAKELSKLSGIPCDSKIVYRIRKTVPQKELDVQGRQNNLKKAFNIPSDVVKLNKTIVIDDIYTTGSTIDAVSGGLKQRGIRNVYFITLCIGEGI